MRISDWSSDVCSSDLFVALPLPRSVLRPAIDDPQDVLPERAVQIALDGAPGSAARPSSLQHKRTAREIAGAYEVVEQSRQNAQGLAAAALGQRTDEESPMLTATSQAVVDRKSTRLNSSH